MPTLVTKAARPESGIVYVVWESPASRWVKIGRTAISAADRFHGGASTDNPRALNWVEFQVADPHSVEQRAHRLLHKVRSATGGSEWFRCTRQDALDAVAKARRGWGRALPERWRLVGPLQPHMTARVYPVYRWRVAWVDAKGNVNASKGKGVRVSGGQTRQQAKAHLERLRLPAGMVAAVLWDRNRGGRWRYELNAN